MTGAHWLGAIAVVAVAVGLGYAGLKVYRGSPSLLAFGRQEDALRFARMHGGEVVPFNEIVSALARRDGNA